MATSCFMPLGSTAHTIMRPWSKSVHVDFDPVLLVPLSRPVAVCGLADDDLRGIIIPADRPDVQSIRAVTDVQTRAQPGGVDDQPRFAPRAQHIAGMQVSRQQHMIHRRTWQLLKQAHSFCDEIGIDPVIGLLSRFVAPVLRHQRQRPKRVR